MSDRNERKKLKKLPVLKTDEEAARFVETADLTEYDLSDFKPTRFEFEKDARVREALEHAVPVTMDTMTEP